MKAVFLKRELVSDTRPSTERWPRPRIPRRSHAVFVRLIPSPFAYWAGESRQNVLRTLPMSRENGVSPELAYRPRTTFGSCRIWFEVPTGPGARDGFRSPRAESSRRSMHLPLVVSWLHGGEEMKAFARIDAGSSHLVLKHPEPRSVLPCRTPWPIKNRSTFKPWPLPADSILALLAQLPLSPHDSWHVLGRCRP